RPSRLRSLHWNEIVTLDFDDPCVFDPQVGKVVCGLGAVQQISEEVYEVTIRHVSSELAESPGELGAVVGIQGEEIAALAVRGRLDQVGPKAKCRAGAVRLINELGQVTGRCIEQALESLSGGAFGKAGFKADEKCIAVVGTSAKPTPAAFNTEM